MNMVAYFHASKFTHFSNTETTKTKDDAALSLLQKIKVILLGVNNPRPKNKIKPSHPFQIVKLKSNKEIECWLINEGSSKGTVILFHGYNGEKSSLLDKAEIFLELGYNTMLVDFMGSGGSEGNQTTIGFYEAKEVKTAVDYLQNRGENNIILFGTSMGAAAIMKAQSDYRLNVKSIIIECPFGTMLETVQARFKTMSVPSFPMANLLVFWGGFQNGFNGFSHNPEEYAKQITCPTLLLYGRQDSKVSIEEVNKIYGNLQGRKALKIYQNAGHENYLNKYKREWTIDVRSFIDSTEKNTAE